MKKFLALFLAAALCLCAFGALADGAVNPADIEDTITSPDGTYTVAFVTDVGQLKDKSFNEGTWNGVKTYAYENGLTYKYYQPANGDQATDDDRYDAMKAAAWASPAAAAAPIPPACATATASLRAPTRPPRSWARPWS